MVHSLPDLCEALDPQLAREQVNEDLALTVLAVSPTQALAAYAQLLADTLCRFPQPQGWVFRRLLYVVRPSFTTHTHTTPTDGHVDRELQREELHTRRSERLLFSCPTQARRSCRTCASRAYHMVITAGLRGARVNTWRPSASITTSA